MATYKYNISNVSDLNTKIGVLDAKIQLDPEIKNNYTSTVHNNGNNTIEVNYTSSLNNDQLDILTQLVNLLIYNVPANRQLITRENKRDTYNNADEPTSSFDIDIGYTRGSIYSTDGDKLYMCIDNSAGSSRWCRIDSSTGPTGVTGLQGLVGSDGVTGPTGIPGISMNDPRVVTVGTAAGPGIDATSIAAAIPLASSLTPTSAAPVTIYVNHGTYYITSGIVLPDYVTLKGAGARGTTIIAAVNTITMIEIGVNGRLIEVTLAGAFGAGGVGFRYNGGVGESCLLDNVVIANCNTCFKIEGGLAIILHARAACTVGLTLSCGLHITGSAEVSLQTFAVWKYAGAITNGILCDSTGFDPKGSAISISGCGVGLKVMDDALFRITGGTIYDCTCGIHLDTGGRIIIHSTGIDNSSQWDIDISHVDCFFVGIGNRIQANKINNTIGATFRSHALSLRPGDEAVQVTPEFHVGTYKHPSESVFGGGDSTTETMVVFSKTLLGPYIDHTEAASTYSGSPFTPYNDLAINSEMYIGGDFKFPGLKFVIDTETTTAATCFDVEFWNGSSWTTLQVMWCESDGERLTFARQHFQTAGSFQVRFGETLDWAQTTVNSENKYWIRFIANSLLTDSPIIEQVKLHTNRTEINSDGFIEHFGTARNICRLPWNLNDNQNFGGSPQNQDLFLSKTVGRGYMENEFDGFNTERVGSNFKVPLDFDTSFPIIFKWMWKNDGSSGTVRWIVRWAYSSTGENIANTSGGAPTNPPNNSEKSVIVDEVVPSTSGNTKLSSAKLDFHDVLPAKSDGDSDLLWIVLERAGGSSADTNSSNSYLVSLTPYYVSWRNGGALSTFYDI